MSWPLAQDLVLYFCTDDAWYNKRVTYLLTYHSMTFLISVKILSCNGTRFQLLILACIWGTSVVHFATKLLNHLMPVWKGRMASWEGWHQRSRSLGQLGRALPVSTFGDTNDATCWPNSPESRSTLQQDQEHSIRKRNERKKVWNKEVEELNEVIKMKITRKMKIKLRTN